MNTGNSSIAFYYKSYSLSLTSNIGGHLGNKMNYVCVISFVLNGLEESFGLGNFVDFDLIFTNPQY